jgi:predicted nucleotidyltransferase
MIITDEIVKIRDIIIDTIPLEKLYLFGSYAYGTPNEDSDYDFYMVIPNNSGIRPIEAMQQARLAIWDLDVKPVDLLAGTVDIFARRSAGITIENKIANEGVLVYER